MADDGINKNGSTVSVETLYALYDQYRNACLNRKYYGKRLVVAKRWNLFSELIIALFGAGAGGVGAFTIWSSVPGAYAWSVLSAISVIMATAKPILNVTSSIEKNAKLHSDYTSSFMTLKALVEDIRAQKYISDADLVTYRRIRSAHTELARDDDPHPKANVIRKLQAEVNSEIPPESLWLP